MNDLTKLFNKYDCDKSYKHGYDSVYYGLMRWCREKPINFLEIGVFKGASTNAFVEFFPNAKIYCLDTFERISPKELSILNHNRVEWLKCDSMDSNLPNLIQSKWPGVEFDFVLDDGAHYPEANRLTFENIMSFVKEGGSYIIEDVFPFDKMTYHEMKHPWLQRFPQRYNRQEYNLFIDSIKKLSLNYDEYDLRKESGEPDSYVIVAEK